MNVRKAIGNLVFRLIHGEPKHRDVPYDWIVIRSGEKVARLHDPEWAEMFWRRAILTPLEAGASKPLFDDDFWAECDFRLTHAYLDLEEHAVIIRATGSPPHVFVRGVTERIPGSKFPGVKGAEPTVRGDG